MIADDFSFGFPFRYMRDDANIKPHLSYPFGPQDQEFGPHKIHASEIFARTALSYAFVNLKPVVPGMFDNVVFCLCLRRCRSGPSMLIYPKLHTNLHGLEAALRISGHVLVCSRRVVQRFTNLRTDEVSDLWWVSVCLAYSSVEQQAKLHPKLGTRVKQYNMLHDSLTALPAAGVQKLTYSRVLCCIGA